MIWARIDQNPPTSKKSAGGPATGDRREDFFPFCRAGASNDPAPPRENSMSGTGFRTIQSYGSRARRRPFFRSDRFASSSRGMRYAGSSRKIPGTLPGVPSSRGRPPPRPSTRGRGGRGSTSHGRDGRVSRRTVSGSRREAVVRIRPGRGRSNHKLLASMAKAKARSKTGRKPRGRVIAATNRQTGRSDLARDRQRKAMQPGKRRSRTGRVYYETRKNRSDQKGKRV